MKSTQVGARSGKARGILGTVAALFFVIASIDAGIYLAELITDGDHWTPMLEVAFVMLLISWIAGALHFHRGKKMDSRSA
ncbi:hypothetical protein E4N62_36475 [Streptomyces sp. MNU76]|uniref:hypothetical protein n=1 Tax=Streptomyces sp. MNU76 TaxID=2560026 RepID=UPI001E4C47FF|nr:hypothetical protein [Streptomyces sp. MNU76]MCC9710275.1 hypothetical protein [Streptomyces sp. MNU76]